MILLDATALIAAFLGEPSGEQVEALLRGGDAGIPAANLTEVFDVLVRVFGNDLEAVEARLVPLLVTSLPVMAIGEAEARRAAQIRSGSPTTTVKMPRSRLPTVCCWAPG